MSDLHYYLPEWVEKSDAHLTVDVCVYGGTSAGIAAAVETRRRGKSVVVLHPGKFVGGLTTGGLGWTDYGRKHVIGGLARDFYRAAGKHYGKDEEFQFEPHVAAAVFDDLLKAHDVDVRLCQYLDAVVSSAGVVKSVVMLGGLRVDARVFLDCTYEGDLLAKAGVSFTTGREGNAQYGETLNGIQVRDTHQFAGGNVDPYVVEGDPASGLLPFVEADDLSRKQGQPDHRVQAYNFRVCMTDDPELIVPWERPEAYDPQLYVLAGRWFRGEKDGYNEQLRDGRPAVPCKFDIFPNKTPGGFHKTDTNNHGPVSSDFIGANWSFPAADYAAREQLFQAHVNYQKGFYWFMANAEEVPERYRAAYARWGLPKDEFLQTGHWPHALYVREGRRMVASYVITEHDCTGARRADDGVGMGSYNMDSHNCTRFVKDGRVMNDGDVQVPAVAYPIPYRSIVPQRTQCTNLLVPVCLSSTHIAYGSARMEPVFMSLGQSAAIAACRAIDRTQPVQDVDYRWLRAQLLEAGVVLEEKKA